MSDEEKPTEPLVGGLTLQEYFTGMRGVAKDVQSLEGTYRGITTAITNLSESLGHVDEGIGVSLKQLNANISAWLDMGRALIRLARLIVIAFVVAIVALISQAIDVEFSGSGIKVHKHGDERNIAAAPTAGVEPSPTR